MISNASTQEAVRANRQPQAALERLGWLFVAKARLLVPASLELPTLRSALEALGNELMVDLATE